MYVQFIWQHLSDQIYRPKSHFFCPSPLHHNLQEYINFQCFVSSFLLIQLKAQTIFSQLQWMNNLRFRTRVNTPHWGVCGGEMVICFWEIFLDSVFSAWSAVLLCVPSEWQPAFPKYDCIGWHSRDCAKLVPWAGQYAWHTCRLLTPDKDYECWTQTHGTIAGNPICCAEIHPGRRYCNKLKTAYSLISILNCYENYFHFILKTSDVLPLFSSMLYIIHG